MDFLLLLARHRRVVLEVDGLQHYADSDGRASPARYAQMAAADRELRLAGYEVYRLGGHEIADRSQAADRSEEHTSELQSLTNLVCRLLLGKKKKEAASCPRQASHTTPDGHRRECP